MGPIVAQTATARRRGRACGSGGWRVRPSLPAHAAAPPRERPAACAPETSQRWEPDVRRLQVRDDEEWTRVWKEFAPRLHAYISRRVFDGAAREDVCQDTMLGAVRGIAAFDSAYTFEQYLFGICRNRVIDHLRRICPRPSGEEDPQDAPWRPATSHAETPDRLAAEGELALLARLLVVNLMRICVREMRAKGKWRHIAVIEALFAGGWRNKDAWHRFELRDETAVAGIKFRFLKRMRELALGATSLDRLVRAVAEAADGDPIGVGFDVAQAWREGRVGCPGPASLAAFAAGELRGWERRFVELHLVDLACSACHRACPANSGAPPRRLPTTAAPLRARPHTK
jgi:DNA-directed RNA polymerase specialized sigma24 family protein